ncbi:MAG: hypothetical protein ACFFCW_29270 [Candidatus Hodarchaeota archaeon]
MFINKKSHLISSLNKVFLLAMGSLFILHFIAIPDVNAQEKCKNALVAAQNMYNVGRSLEAITLLNSCLPDSIAEVERARAYKLLALAYIAEVALDEAKNAIEKLLDIDKNFRPDATRDPARFVELTQEAIKKHEGKRKLRNYLLIGGGIATAVAIVVVIQSPEKQQPLPEPPALPGNH